MSNNQLLFVVVHNNSTRDKKDDQPNQTCDLHCVQCHHDKFYFHDDNRDDEDEQQQRCRYQLISHYCRYQFKDSTPDRMIRQPHDGTVDKIL